MGSHPNGPSKLLGIPNAIHGNELSLADWINAFPSVLGTDVNERFGRSLPYLFKVLSIKKSLSIQAHPSKEHAQILHKERPDLYKDPNHKPELAIGMYFIYIVCIV